LRTSCWVLFVVVTTCRNGTCDMLTLAKLLVGYLVVGIIRELDKKPSLHCSSIYINIIWSMLQQYLPALMSMPLSHVLLLRLPCRIYMLWRHTLQSPVYMHTPCVHHKEPLSLDIIPNPNSDLNSSWFF